MTHREAKKYCEAIAHMFGAKIVWLNNDGGYWDHGNKLYVGQRQGTDSMIGTFCHELAHYMNYLDGRYPLYHQKIKNVGRFFKSLDQQIAYAHKAEVYTDRRGKEIAKLFFPEVRYHAFYKTGSKKSRGFMFGYYYLNTAA